MMEFALLPLMGQIDDKRLLRHNHEIQPFDTAMRYNYEIKYEIMKIEKVTWIVVQCSHEMTNLGVWGKPTVIVLTNI